MKIDFQKNAERVGNAFVKAAELGKKAADSTMTGAQLLATKAQEENLKAQIKRYNPVFPDQYKEGNFGLPNLIMIVDDAVRKDIEVCKGAIGWISTQKGVEVFYLYDEAIAYSGLHFVPAAVCDSIYYIDPHDKSRFIRLDCYFEKMQESRLAELQHIAYVLGAKKYSVEIYDTSNEIREVNQNASVKKKSAAGILKFGVTASEERAVEAQNQTERKSVAFAEFSGDRSPALPNLHWFDHDDNIKNLIHMRCSGEHAQGIKVFTIEFNGADYATMGAQTAAKIDGAIGKIGAGSEFKMQSKVIEERKHKMSFQVEF